MPAPQETMAEQALDLVNCCHLRSLRPVAACLQLSSQIPLPGDLEACAYVSKFNSTSLAIAQPLAAVTVSAGLAHQTASAHQ